MSSLPEDATRPAPATPDAAESPTEQLRRIERLLVEIRGCLETLHRAQHHQEFSPARLIGAVLQMVTVAFLLAAVADWVYQAQPATQIIKLMFAGVVQLGALTAFVVARGSE
jgi:hypothetical protein